MTIRFATLLIAVLSLFTGCSKPAKKVVTVTGTVKYNGQTVKGGVLKFQAPNGDFGMAPVGMDGKFTMTDVVPGLQKVAYLGGPMGSGSSDGTKTQAEKGVSVPNKFADFESSGATFTVTEQPGEVTVELK
jgi:hypothetical protein